MGVGSEPSFRPTSQSNVSTFRSTSASGAGPEYYSRATSVRPSTSDFRRKDGWSDFDRRLRNLVNDDVGSYRYSTSSGDLARLPSTPGGSSASSGVLPIYRMSSTSSFMPSSAGNFRMQGNRPLPPRPSASEWAVLPTRQEYMPSRLVPGQMVRVPPQAPIRTVSLKPGAASYKTGSEEVTKLLPAFLPANRPPLPSLRQ